MSNNRGGVMKKATIVAVLALTGLGLSGCGGDDDEGIKRLSNDPFHNACVEGGPKFSNVAQSKCLGSISTGSAFNNFCLSLDKPIVCPSE